MRAQGMPGEYVGMAIGTYIPDSPVPFGSEFDVGSGGHRTERRERMKVLELFAGSGSFGAVARSAGCETFSVDWHPYPGIDMCADVESLAIYSVPFIPDVVWASPDCTTYSIAAISTHRNGTEPKSEYALKCDSVNQHFIGLIKAWLAINPSLKFFIENPRGMLRKMPWMLEFDRHTVWYCQYGDDRAKPTDIFTNLHSWVSRPVCRNGNKDCHHQPAPRGAKTGTQGRGSKFERSKIPDELCFEILQSIHSDSPASRTAPHFGCIQFEDKKRETDARS